MPISGMSITLSGHLNDSGAEYFKRLFDNCKCDRFWKYHSRHCKSFPGALMLDSEARQAAAKFMEEIGLTPTPDAIDQMVEVFAPCLRIMCERPYDPQGGTWRKSGRFGILGDVRKKFERLWFFYWQLGKEHKDSGHDLINFIGFLLRTEDNRWGEWGEPAEKAE